MDSAKVKSKTNRDEKQATAKLDEQIEKVKFVMFSPSNQFHPLILLNIFS